MTENNDSPAPASSPASQPATPAQPAAPSTPRTPFGALLLAALLGAGIVFALQFFIGAGSSNLETRVNHLESQHAQDAEGNGQAASATHDGTVQGSARLATIEQELDRLEARTEQLAADLEKRSQPQGELVKQAVAGLAAAGLIKALETGLPFPGDYRLLQLIPDLSPELVTALAPYAESGIPTQTALKNQFKRLEKTIAWHEWGAAEDPTNTSEAFLHQSWQAVANGFTNGWAWLRATLASSPRGDTDAQGPLAIMARVKQDLDKDAMDQAITHLAELEGEPQALAAPFLEQVEARHGAQHLLAQIERE